MADPIASGDQPQPLLTPRSDVGVSIDGFTHWYNSTWIANQNVYLQFLTWMLAGYIWIPLMYLNTSFAKWFATTWVARQVAYVQVVVWACGGYVVIPLMYIYITTDGTTLKEKWRCMTSARKMWTGVILGGVGIVALFLIANASMPIAQTAITQEAGESYDGSAELPTGLTSTQGVRLGPHFSREELREVAGRFIQNEIQPGWQLERVIAVMGKPTVFQRTNGLSWHPPEKRKQFLEDPLIPPSVKREMQKETAICTWSDKEDPDSYFIMLLFEEGVLADWECVSINLSK